MVAAKSAKIPFRQWAANFSVLGGDDQTLLPILAKQTLTVAARNSPLGTILAHVCLADHRRYPADNTVNTFAQPGSVASLSGYAYCAFSAVAALDNMLRDR